jgi:hypothetical protein
MCYGLRWLLPDKESIMIKLQATSRELFEGHVNAGITMWWVPGQHVVLFRTWEHRASGRTYGDVQETFTSDDLLTYFVKQGWADEYQVSEVTEIGKLA